MENQALKFISIHVEDERCCRSCQQEYQEYYIEDGSHVQGLAWNASFCSTYTSHRNKDIYKSYTLFLGLQDGRSNAARSINLFFKGTDEIKTWGSWLGQDEIQAVKSDQWKEVSYNISSSIVSTKNG